MKKSLWFLSAFIWMTAAHSLGLAAELNLPQEIQALKERLEELEEKLEEQESLAQRQAAKSETKMEEKIGEALEERFGTLEIHGGAILYFQDSRTDELEGVRADSPGGGRPRPADVLLGNLNTIADDNSEAEFGF